MIYWRWVIRDLTIERETQSCSLKEHGIHFYNYSIWDYMSGAGAYQKNNIGTEW